MRRAVRTPLSELMLLQREVNRLFERLAEHDRGEATAGEWTPSVDVFECRGRLTVVAEVPALGPESLRVFCKDHTLVITGERRERRATAANASFLCMERPHGRFTRSIPLDLALDLRQAEARLAGGLLTVTIPRVKDRRGRELVIPIKHDEERS